MLTGEKRRNIKRASRTTHAALCGFYPTAAKERWSGTRLAKEAGVTIPVANKFLLQMSGKCELLALEAVVRLPGGAWPLLHEIAVKDAETADNLRNIRRSITEERHFTAAVVRLAAITGNQK